MCLKRGCKFSKEATDQVAEEPQSLLNVLFNALIAETDCIEVTALSKVKSSILENLYKIDSNDQCQRRETYAVGSHT